MANKIEEVRIRKGLSRLDLARKLTTTQQTVWRLEKGGRKLTQDWIERIACALDCNPAELLGAECVKAKAKLIPLVGYVGVSEMIYPDPSVGPWGTIELVESPPGADGVLAVRVRGNDLYPAYRVGDLLFFHETRVLSGGYVGKDCIVQCVNGLVLLKILLPPLGDSNTYVLRSVVGRGPDLSVAIVWASPVVWVKRA